MAVRPSGNVYEAETIERLNAKTKNWHDLLTEEAFTRKDIIDLQDPTRLDYRHNFAKFYHVVNKISVNAEGACARTDSSAAHPGFRLSHPARQRARSTVGACERAIGARR